MDDLVADKRKTVEEGLEQGIVMLHIDSRRDEVDVPGHLLGDRRLLLNIAWGFNLPELTVDDDGVYAVLSFGGVNHGCRLPWSAIYAMTLPEANQSGVLWPASMPEEGLLAAPQLRELDRVLLGPMPDEDDTPEDPPDDEPEPEPPKRDRSHLRLVKG